MENGINIKCRFCEESFTPKKVEMKGNLAKCPFCESFTKISPTEEDALGFKRHHPSDERNEKIRKLWETRTYTKAEIGRLIGVSRERIRQILARTEVDGSHLSTDFDWATLKEIRKLLKIKYRKSTHRQLEDKVGIYKYPRVSVVAVEYHVYVLEEAMSILIKLKALMKKLKLPENN